MTDDREAPLPEEKKTRHGLQHFGGSSHAGSPDTSQRADSHRAGPVERSIAAGQDEMSESPLQEAPIVCPGCRMSGKRKRDEVSHTTGDWFRCGSHAYVTDERPYWDKDAPAFEQSAACERLEAMRAAARTAKAAVERDDYDTALLLLGRIAR